MNEIELSNKNGIPISTVGELKEVLIPFMDECPINDISVFYVGSGTDGARLSIRPCNTQLGGLMEWIKVEDKLPEKDTDVLTYSEDYGHVIGHIESDFKNQWCAADTDYETGEPWLPDAKITHWMPLPPAP